MSSECQQLNRLFSQCVDGNHIKVPQALEDPPEPTDVSEHFILDMLHVAAKELIAVAADRSVSYDEYAPDTIDLLLSRDNVALSEIELIQLAFRWCALQGRDFQELMPFFDYSRLSDEQRAWLLGQLLPSAELPGLVRNGLLQSQLVNPAELRHFKLESHNLHWKPVFDSTSYRMGFFLPTVCRTMDLFHKKLIVLRVDERLTLMIYIPRRIEQAAEVQVDSSVRVFALPQSQGSGSPGYTVVPTKKNYRLYYDESAFQLYEGKRANTWVFLTRSQKDDSSYRNIKSKGDKRRVAQQALEEGINFDCRASIALQKINKGIERHIGRLNRAGILGAVSKIILFMN